MRRKSGTSGPAVNAPGEELVEVVDETGSVVGVVTRAEMRARNLRHRSVFVVVRDGDRVLAHQRASWKDAWPSAWDVAFGGVVGVGEGWATAARRELREEAGVDVDEHALRRVGSGSYEDERVRAVCEVFEVDWPGPFSFDDGEVVTTEWVSLDALDEWVATRDVVPDSRALVVPLVVR